MAKAKRLEFNDAQKAEIYARDRAICGFSGKSLWILDYGLSPTYDIDWVDHIRPASKGGGNDIENGICASSYYNSKKNDNSRDNSYLFHKGKPTYDFYKHFEVIPIEVAEHLERFSKAKKSDWYFNRAASRFLYGIEWLVNIKKGIKHKRDDLYYSQSTLKALEDWRRKSKNDNSFESRGLINKNISEDQLLILRLRDLNTVDEIVNHMRACDIWYETGTTALQKLSQVKSNTELDELVSQYTSSPNVPQRIMNMLKENKNRLNGKLTNN